MDLVHVFLLVLPNLIEPIPLGLPLSPSSSGLGRRPFTALTRVQIPLGTPDKEISLHFICIYVGPVAQLVSAPPCHGGGRGFKSRLGRMGKLSIFLYWLSYKTCIRLNALIGFNSAQIPRGMLKDILQGKTDSVVIDVGCNTGEFTERRNITSCFLSLSHSSRTCWP